MSQKSAHSSSQTSVQSEDTALLIKALTDYENKYLAPVTSRSQDKQEIVSPRTRSNTSQILSQGRHFDAQRSSSQVYVADTQSSSKSIASFQPRRSCSTTSPFIRQIADTPNSDSQVAIYKPSSSKSDIKASFDRAEDKYFLIKVRNPAVASSLKASCSQPVFSRSQVPSNKLDKAETKKREVVYKACSQPSKPIEIQRDFLGGANSVAGVSNATQYLSCPSYESIPNAQQPRVLSHEAVVNFSQDAHRVPITRSASKWSFDFQSAHPSPNYETCDSQEFIPQAQRNATISLSGHSIWTEDLSRSASSLSQRTQDRQYSTPAASEGSSRFHYLSIPSSIRGRQYTQELSQKQKASPEIYRVVETDEE